MECWFGDGGGDHGDHVCFFVASVEIVFVVVMKRRRRMDRVMDGSFLLSEK